jgi:hypothetical protein
MIKLKFDPVIKLLLKKQKSLFRIIRGVMFISSSFTRMAQAGWKASLLTTSGMLLHAFPSMSVSSLREFPEYCAYRHGGFNCFIKYLHRKVLPTNFSLMILKVLNKVYLLDLYIKTITWFSCSITIYMYLILTKMTKHFGTNQLFPLLKYMINIS